MNKFKIVWAYAKNFARFLGYAVYVSCVTHCVLEYVGDLVMCIGPSMEPTIFSENIVLAEHLTTHLNKISRGDIVITRSHFNPNHIICKRVIAVAGDKVGRGFFTQIVPKGHVWLEGDNKHNSSDSRSYGPVPQGLIKGRVICRIWPLSSIKMLTDKTKSNS